MKYYSTQRPITPGSFPKSPFNKVQEIVNFDSRIFCEEIQRPAWGYIIYEHPLHPEDAMDYELMPIPSKIVKVIFAGTDSWGRRVYIDQAGKLWKYTDPGDIPCDRHERLHTSAGNELDGEPGWPLKSDMDYLIVEEY